MNIWFTSDTHFGHANIVRGCSDWFDRIAKPQEEFSSQEDYSLYLSEREYNIKATRDFKTIEEHDDYILSEINKRVRSSDVLYHLGDFGLGIGFKDKVKSLRERINCETIYLAIGNHDKLFEPRNIDKHPEIKSLFKEIRHLYYRKINNRNFVLCHYAMLTWPWQHHQSYMLHGHSHGNLPDDPNAFRLDVGVDTCLYGHEKFTPYSFEEVSDIMASYKKFVPVDHHS